jgi:hypothetical protein
MATFKYKPDKIKYLKHHSKNKNIKQKTKNKNIFFAKILIS